VEWFAKLFGGLLVFVLLPAGGGQYSGQHDDVDIH